MLKKLLAAVSVGLACVGSAMASPVPTLPSGPLYFEFSNREQIAIIGNTGGPDTQEINWGVLVVSTINRGTVSGNSITKDTDSPAVFSNITNGQITGMFYGIHTHAPSGGNAFPATSGFLDLYYRDASMTTATPVSLAATLPNVRTGFNTAGVFTDGQLLAHIEFASGINTDPTVFINGTSTITGPFTTFSGSATSYGNIGDTNADSVINAADGAWATILNQDFFTTAFGTRDFTFRNVYEELPSWDNTCYPLTLNGTPSGNCIVGARSSDPATSVAIPEPGTLALLGLSLLGLAGLRRKQSA